MIRMLRCLSLIALTSIFVILPGAASARSLLKIATLVPEGSVWYKIFSDMSDEVESSSNGSVQVRLYPGGVAGDEPDMVRKMRIGQLHGAILTVSGLSDIDDRFSIFQVPLLLRSYDELWHLVDELEPELAAALEKKGFRLVHWGGAGWVHLFSKRPVVKVEDLRRVKLFTWAGDDRMVQLWKKNGFHPVALAATDVMTGLQTGMIDGLPTTPLAALSLQWFRLTPHMMDLGVAPLLGATIVTEKAWQKLTPGERKALMEAGRKAGASLRRQIPVKDREAIAEMEKRGLEVHSIEDEAVMAQWEEIADGLVQSMRGSMIPEEIFDRAIRELESFRSRVNGGSP